jgi:glycosyltransferase involved in cell wall biosynthesis
VAFTAPDISIIIPVHNSVTFFRQTMESVLAQDMRNYEVIVVNDSSTDGSRDIAEELKRLYGRIRIIDLEGKQGAGAARNLALYNAYGEYVIFADPTDLFQPDMATSAYETAKQHDADLVIFESEPIYSEDRIEQPRRMKASYPAVFKPEDHPGSLFEDFGFNLNSMAFRREFLLESQIMFPSMPHDESLLFTCSALATANLIVRLQRPLYQHRQAVENDIDPNLSPLDFHECLRLLRAYLEYRDLFTRYRQTFANLAAAHVIDGLMNAETSHAFIRAYEFLHIRGISDLGFVGADAVMPEDEGESRMLRVIVENDMISGMFEFWHYDRMLLQEQLAQPAIQFPSSLHRRGGLFKKKRSSKRR